MYNRGRKTSGDTMTDDIGSGYASGLLTGMTHGVGSGIDAGTLALMNSNGGLGGNNSWLVLFFLLILGGRGGFGSWGNPVADDLAKNSTVINEANYGRLMDAIGQQGIRQENAIQGLAQSFNCKTSDILGALASVDKQIALSNGDLRSSIQAVGTQIVNAEGSVKSAIQSCCCNIGRSIDQASAHTDLEMVKGFGDVKQDIQQTRYLVTAADAAQTANINQHFADQSFMIQQKFCDQNAYLASQFAEIKLREDQRQINDLQSKLADAKATANTQAILAAIYSRDKVDVAGTVNTTTGAWTGSGSVH